jgi:hypothetical protein
MAILFGPAFAGLARLARALGLAFATALQVHIGLVVWLGVVIGQIPLQGGELWFFLVALFFTDLLVLVFFGIGMRNLGRLWRPLLFLGTTCMLIVFGRDFVPGALDQKTQYLALRRRICAVRRVEPYCNPAAPCRVSSPALQLAFRRGLTHLAKLFHSGTKISALGRLVILGDHPAPTRRAGVNRTGME